MCGRFYIDPDDMSDEELIALLNREKSIAEDMRDDGSISFGEVCPGNFAAVIALNRRLRRSAFAMQWGFRLNKRLIINARSETAAEKPLFRQSMQQRRCLIPASAYFEWDHRCKPYQKYRFWSPEQRMIYLAGIYRFEEDSPLPRFTILTRDAAPEISCFHDRMPVIIPHEMTDAWLDQSNSAEAMLAGACTQITWDQAI